MSNHRTSHEELQKILEEAKQKIIVGGIYYHYKNPDKQYKVLEIGLSESDEMPCVIYQQINTEYPLVWIRKINGDSGWLTSVEKDGLIVPRFTILTH